MIYDNLPVHEGFILQTAKQPRYLRNAIWQFPFKDPGELLRKNQKYSDLGASKLKNKRITFASAFGHSVWAFSKHYFCKFGFLDGWRGFVIAYSNSEGTFYKYLKALTRQNAARWRPGRQD
jgi:hypothetical protein